MTINHSAQPRLSYFTFNTLFNTNTFFVSSILPFFIWSTNKDYKAFSLGNLILIFSVKSLMIWALIHTHSLIDGCNMNWPQNTYPLSSVYLTWICAQNTLHHYCMIEFQFGYLEAAADFVKIQQFFKVLPSSCVWIHQRFFHSVSPEASVFTGSTVVFTHWGLNRIPESFLNINNCIRWKTSTLCNLCNHTVVPQPIFAWWLQNTIKVVSENTEKNFFILYIQQINKGLIVVLLQKNPNHPVKCVWQYITQL